MHKHIVRLVDDYELIRLKCNLNLHRHRPECPFDL